MKAIYQGTNCHNTGTASTITAIEPWRKAIGDLPFHTPQCLVGSHLPEEARSCPEAHYQANTEISKYQLPQHRFCVNERRCGVANKSKEINCFFLRWRSPFPYTLTYMLGPWQLFFLWKLVWNLAKKWAPTPKFISFLMSRRLLSTLK